MSEKEVEQSYNEEMLGKVLGYTNFPTNPYTRQPQPKTEVTWQKPDFWLGFYYQDGEQKDKTLAVIEVKDAHTDISKSQKREGNLSPIQQGFKYKPQYSDCRWVIVSNFYETKLFVDTMIDYETWTLDTLLDETDNYFQFRKFYYLLCAENFIKETGKSKTEDLLSAVRIQEEQITKKFYQEYKQLRLALIRDLQKRNPNISITTLVAKAQKIIDRLVFIHFCEDLGLLPQGKLKENVLRAGEIDVSPRHIVKIYFKWVDSWSDKLGIPDGYNGWLFAEDSILNGLTVGDDVCRQFVDLGNYDFSEDVWVNILGHIFEQSISDLEEIKADLLEEKGSSKAWEAIVNRRKKDGIFYTPEYIVDYIVTNSLGKYLDEKFEELTKVKKNEFELYQAYQKVLQNVKVLDPACGSGAFLVRVFDFLLEENKKVMKILAKGNTGFFDTNAMSKEILQNNIFWVDLNDESVEISKLSLWLKTAQKWRKLASLDKNIKCGNSLIDDPEVAGEKAFDWGAKFPNIFWNKFKIAEKNWKDVYITVDNISKLKTSEKEFANKLRNYNINIWFFPIDALLGEKIDDAEILKNHKKKYNQLVPIIVGDSFDTLELKNDLWFSYKNNWKIIEQESSFTNQMNGGRLKLFEEMKTHFLNLYGKALINSNIQDFLILFNFWFSRQSRIGFFTYRITNNNTIDIHIDNKKKQSISNILITDDNKWIFQKEYRDKIQEKYGIQIISSTEFIAELDRWFDVIVGNPPYVEIQKLNPVDVAFLRNTYETAKNKNIDIYVTFYEKWLKLLKKDWVLSYITPNRFMNSAYWELLLRFFEKYNIERILNFKHYLVFEEADVYTVILTARNQEQKDNIEYLETKGFYRTDNEVISVFINDIENISLISPEFKRNQLWNLMSDKEMCVLEKCNTNKKLWLYTKEFFVGIQTSFDSFFILKFIRNIDTKTWVFYSKFLDEEVELEKEMLLEIVSNPDIKEYSIKSDNHYVIFPYKDWKLLDFDFIRTNYPKIGKYLEMGREDLEKREKEKFVWAEFFRYWRNQNIDKQDYKKLLIPHITKSMRCAFDEEGKYAMKNVWVNGVVLKDEYKDSYKYFLCLLNSKVLTFILSKISIFLAGGFYASNKQFAEKLPIPDISSLAQKPFIEKADQMLLMNKELQEKKDFILNFFQQKYSIETLSTKLQHFYDHDFSEFKKQLKLKKLGIEEEAELMAFFDKKKAEISELKEKIDATDREIDEMVFELYGLSEEERTVVLGG